MPDVKTIHAITADRTYVLHTPDRKWYAQDMNGRRRISLAEAVELATRRGSWVDLKPPGGSVFAARVRAVILERAR